ncbi:hypothetical protein, partial [Salmonella sp. s57402]|uniref:hypothetical protein n=1 Tax=Salmonella sp. s57402 TaxID=3159695 RepID=UPI00397EF87A
GTLTFTNTLSPNGFSFVNLGATVVAALTTQPLRRNLLIRGEIDDTLTVEGLRSTPPSNEGNFLTEMVNAVS